LSTNHAKTGTLRILCLAAAYLFAFSATAFIAADGRQPTAPSAIRTAKRTQPMAPRPVATTSPTCQRGPTGSTGPTVNAPPTQHCAVAMALRAPLKGGGASVPPLGILVAGGDPPTVVDFFAWWHG
jgi:hypothetical protein